MNVLVISNYTDHHSTRPEGCIFIALSKMGFKVHVMTYKGLGYAIEMGNAGLTVVDFHPEKKFDKSEIARIRAYLIEQKIDIVHAFNSPSTINTIRAAKGLAVKVVLYRGYSGHIHWYDPSAYVKYLHPRVNAIMCNSIGVEEMFHRQLFFKRTKAITINKGHDVGWYKDVAPLKIREELGLSKQDLLLVNVCNNRKMKGIPYLLSAMQSIKGQSVHLILVGKNLDTKENLRKIKKSGIQNQIHFMGFRKDALNIVAACNVFVLPSIKGESITKSVIEAMSLKVTPIISDIRGNVELVEDGENGLVFPNKDSKALATAISTLNHDRALCTQMGIKAQQHIQNTLNHKHTAEKVRDLYQSLLTENS